MIASLYEPFKKWSEQGSVWLISDPHFDDEESVLMNPGYLPAANAEEYIKILNKMIYKNDTLVCLGDCGNLMRFTQIKCNNIVLVRGNHDDKGSGYYAPYFNEVYNGPLFIAPQILLSHEPVNGLTFCLNIHGHCHNGVYDYTDSQGGRHLNVAADVVQYQPISLGKLIKAGAVAGLPTIHRLVIDRRD